jgi:hypothetical protein
MKAGRALLVATMIASVATASMAQGRGGNIQRRGDTLTEQQRQSIRTLRERHRREATELRSRHRDQMERALPPAARQRLEQRRNQLQREGRMFERQQQMGRGRAGQFQRRAGIGGRGGPGVIRGGGAGIGGRGGPGVMGGGRAGIGGRGGPGVMGGGRAGIGGRGGPGVMGGGRAGIGGRGGPPLRGRMIGPRGRGAVPPDSGVGGRVRDGR